MDESPCFYYRIAVFNVIFQERQMCVGETILDDPNFQNYHRARDI